MLYRPFGNTGWTVSAIGMGTWNIGNQWGAVDDATAWATVRAAFEQGIGVLVRGPLRQGLLAGKYTREAVFADSVRSRWNEGESGREGFERDVAQVDRLRASVQPGEEMVTTALRYVLSHPAAPVAIPGAKSPAQAIMNAAAGERTLSEQGLAELRALLDQEAAPGTGAGAFSEQESL